jgi:hypothetical protein
MKRTIAGLLLAAAAYGIYRYTKMTPQQKNDLKRRGKDFLDKNVSDVNNLFRKRATANHADGL